MNILDRHCSHKIARKRGIQLCCVDLSKTALSVAGTCCAKQEPVSGASLPRISAMGLSAFKGRRLPNNVICRSIKVSSWSSARSAIFGLSFFFSLSLSFSPFFPWFVFSPFWNRIKVFFQATSFRNFPKGRRGCFFTSTSSDLYWFGSVWRMWSYPVGNSIWVK